MQRFERCFSGLLPPQKRTSGALRQGRILGGVRKGGSPCQRGSARSCLKRAEKLHARLKP
eukprot:2857998-Alexandrium_andersonii.AAC.1